MLLGRRLSWVKRAGRIKSTKTRSGNKYLKAAQGVAAMSASRQKDAYLAVKYRRIATRQFPSKAMVAIEHSILTAVWHMLSNGGIYQDLGADYYARIQPQKAKSRGILQLENLGYQVQGTPMAA